MFTLSSCTERAPDTQQWWAEGENSALESYTLSPAKVEKHLAGSPLNRLKREKRKTNVGFCLLYEGFQLLWNTWICTGKLKIDFLYLKVILFHRFFWWVQLLYLQQRLQSGQAPPPLHFHWPLAAINDVKWKQWKTFKQDSIHHSNVLIWRLRWNKLENF